MMNAPTQSVIGRTVELGGAVGGVGLAVGDHFSADLRNTATTSWPVRRISPGEKRAGFSRLHFF